MSFASIVSVSENKSILSDRKNCMNNEGKEEEDCTEITLDSQQQLLLEKYSRKNKTTRKESNVPLHSSNMVPCSKGIENTTAISTTGSEEVRNMCLCFFLLMQCPSQKNEERKQDALQMPIFPKE